MTTIFSEDQDQKIRAAAQYHQDHPRTGLDLVFGTPDSIEDETLVSACIVVLDYECASRFADFHEITVTEEEIQDFLKQHKDIAKATSALTGRGALVGVLDFLDDED